MKRLILVAAAMAAPLFGLAAPAEASTVTVDFRLTAGPLATTPVNVSCPVEVAPGANGMAVLDAAKDRGCIVSYRTTSYSFGTFLDCINEVCGQVTPFVMAGLPTAGTYWSLLIDGAYAQVGLDGYSAAAGSSLGANYDTFVF